MEDMREKTHARHYELYRRRRLQQMGFTDVDADNKPVRARAGGAARRAALAAAGLTQSVRAGVVPADLRAEAQRAPGRAAAEGGRDAPDLRAARQGEGGRTQGSREGGVYFSGAGNVACQRSPR